MEPGDATPAQGSRRVTVYLPQDLYRAVLEKSREIGCSAEEAAVHLLHRSLMEDKPM
jgi:hypothetical protein